jgi:hypothetical protein
VTRTRASLYNVPAAFALATALAVVALTASRPAAQTEAASPCDLTTTERVVAIGDVHGAFDPFVDILREAGLVDRNRRWSGGRAVLVQTGDVLDRGPDSKRVLDLLKELEIQAARAGGQVHALAGNHEVMRLVGDLRYVSAKEYSAFVTPESAGLRDALYDSASTAVKEQRRKEGAKFDEGAYRKAFYAETPLGFVEMLRAFSSKGDYGAWLRNKRTFVKVNGVIYVHGGFAPAVAAEGCAALATRTRQQMQAATFDASTDVELLKREDGPLWYRGLADGTATETDVTAVLTALGAKAIVVGHTPTKERKIQSLFGGRVIAIDTGMLGGTFYPNGVPSALEIAGDTMTAIYIGKKEPLATGK